MIYSHIDMKEDNINKKLQEAQEVLNKLSQKADVGNVIINHVFKGKIDAGITYSNKTIEISEDLLDENRKYLDTILAHEVGHLVLAKTLKGFLAKNLMMIYLPVFIILMCLGVFLLPIHPLLTELSILGLGVVFLIIQRACERSNELQTDILGIKLNNNDYKSAINAFKAIIILRNTNNENYNTMKLFRSHPKLEDRIINIENNKNLFSDTDYAKLVV